MPKKIFDPAGHTVKVTFTLPAAAQAETACLCGDFNAWDQTSHPMKKQRGGSFKLAVKLEAGRRYQYRYFLDGGRWENDWDADGYAPNPFNGENSVLDLEGAPAGDAVT